VAVCRYSNYAINFGELKMKILEAIQKLAEIKKTGWQTMVSDGAEDWDLDNLYDEINREANCGNIDEDDYSITQDGIVKLDSQGYLSSVVDYRLM